MGNHPPDAAPRIGHVAVPPGIGMNVRVHHGLARRETIIEADFEAVGYEPSPELLANPANQFPNSAMLIFRKFEERCGVPPRNDKSVPVGDRESVGKGDGAFRL